MWAETRDEQLFRKFWEDERDNFPRWFTDASNSNNVTWEEFKDFCDRMWKIYTINDEALVYIETVRNIANAHFSLLRGAKIDIEGMIGVRNDIVQTVPIIIGWSGVHNRGLCRMLENIGFWFDGFTMFKGQSHGKVLEWKCYVYKKPLDKPNPRVLLSI